MQMIFPLKKLSQIEYTWSTWSAYVLSTLTSIKVPSMSEREEVDLNYNEDLKTKTFFNLLPAGSYAAKNWNDFGGRNEIVSDETDGLFFSLPQLKRRLFLKVFYFPKNNYSRTSEGYPVCGLSELGLEVSRLFFNPRRIFSLSHKFKFRSSGWNTLFFSGGVRAVGILSKLVR